MRGEVQKILCYPAKGVPGRGLKSCRLVAGGGMEGDLHGGDSKRPLCLLDRETRDWMSRRECKGLCFARFKENLLLSGFDTGALRPGDRLAVGTAILRIADVGKDCHGECPLCSRGLPCRLSGNTKFAVTVQAGVVTLGDAVQNMEEGEA